MYIAFEPSRTRQSRLVSPGRFVVYYRYQNGKGWEKALVVIFDPEGVLTNTEPCRFAAWREMAREQGILYDEALDAQLQGMEPETRLQGILSRAHRNYSSAERLALLTRQNDLRDDEMKRLGDGALRPGAEHTLRSLRKHGAQLGAVMTDGLPGQVLGYLSIRPLFSVISRREDLLSQLSDVQLRLNAAPDECLLVTASPSSAKAARSLGMQALLCARTEEQEAVLRQILAILPDFDSQNHQ